MQPPRVGLSLPGPLPPPPSRAANSNRGRAPSRAAVRGACFAAAAASAAAALTVAHPATATVAAPTSPPGPRCERWAPSRRVSAALTHATAQQADLRVLGGAVVQKRPRRVSSASGRRGAELTRALTTLPWLRAGFHKPEVHETLLHYRKEFLGDASARVLVPLCGALPGRACCGMRSLTPRGRQDARPGVARHAQRRQRGGRRRVRATGTGRVRQRARRAEAQKVRALDSMSQSAFESKPAAQRSTARPRADASAGASRRARISSCSPRVR